MDQQYNVYAGELTAFLLALHIFRQEICTYTNSNEMCDIYSDSQAAIRAITNLQKQLGQAIIKDILDEIDAFQQLYNITFVITWIPGHEEI